MVALAQTCHPCATRWTIDYTDCIQIHIRKHQNQNIMANRTFMPSAPNRGLWIVAVIIGLLGILVHFVEVSELSKYSFEMVLIGFVLLLIGTAYRRV